MSSSSDRARSNTGKQKPGQKPSTPKGSRGVAMAFTHRGWEDETDASLSSGTLPPSITSEEQVKGEVKGEENEAAENGESGRNTRDVLSLISESSRLERERGVSRSIDKELMAARSSLLMEFSSAGSRVPPVGEGASSSSSSSSRCRGGGSGGDGGEGGSWRAVKGG